MQATLFANRAAGGLILLAALAQSTVHSEALTPAPNRDEMNADARRMLEHMAWPFGRVNDADIDRLQDFALKCGFDFRAEMARVYGEKKLDEDALARVFIFSRQFNRLDKNARTYGHFIHCSLLNIGEVIGVPAYVKIIDRQPPEVQQRVRDFLWYPTWHDQHKQNDGELESVYPGLFPKSYEFGRDDPIFANET
jgi:hypothetical protein